MEEKIIQEQKRYPSNACTGYDACDRFWWYGDHWTPFYCDTSKCPKFKLREDYKPKDTNNDNKDIQTK